MYHNGGQVVCNDTNLWMDNNTRDVACVLLLTVDRAFVSHRVCWRVSCRMRVEGECVIIVFLLRTPSAEAQQYQQPKCAWAMEKLVLPLLRRYNKSTAVDQDIQYRYSIELTYHLPFF